MGATNITANEPTKEPTTLGCIHRAREYNNYVACSVTATAAAAIIIAIQQDQSQSIRRRSTS